jgi:hypothetical protein
MNNFFKDTMILNLYAPKCLHPISKENIGYKKDI